MTFNSSYRAYTYSMKCTIMIVVYMYNHDHSMIVINNTFIPLIPIIPYLPSIDILTKVLEYTYEFTAKRSIYDYKPLLLAIKLCILTYCWTSTSTKLLLCALVAFRLHSVDSVNSIMGMPATFNKCRHKN